MSKRFTDTSKWDDPWFRELQGAHKLVFLFIIDRCDNAGFWELDEAAIAWHTKLDPKHIQGAIKGLERGLVLCGGWVWVRTFLRHQKNETLNDANPSHRQIIGLINLQVERFSNCSDFVNFLAPYKPHSWAIKWPIGIGKGNGKGQKEEGMQGGKTPKPPAGEVVFPEVLNTENFRAAWGEWTAHRMTIRKKLTPQGITRQLRDLAAMGHDRAIETIDNSIKNGWTGLFSSDRARQTEFPKIDSAARATTEDVL